MRKILGAAALLLIMAGTAAADGAARRGGYKSVPPPARTWAGFYVGGFVGGAWGDDVRVQELGAVAAPTVPYNSFTPFSTELDGSFLGGVTVGYNYQWSWLLTGIEADLGWFRLTGSGADPVSPALDTVSRTEIGDWFGVIAARIGLASEQVLVYSKIGVAFVDVTSSIVDTCSVAPCGTGLVTASTSSTSTGLAIGGGIEYAMSANLSLKAEYLFLDIEDHTVTGTLTAPVAAPFSWNHEPRGVHTARIGFNVKFAP
jgi:outer membrane immunogenic protein